ncbi:OmpA family protein [Halomonas pacifica]|uniref:OmpA family protein n=1 Tax=Bisbaumannia pacifica TaxID=77098 RepID=UPI00235A0B35|nr:OmpA family protein [Halomonas pacifica]MDC8804749.1 OmpA family protein [Halomonas pacifica]
MKKSTTGLLLGSALVIGLSGCASTNSNPSASDRAWYQQPLVCGIAGGLIGGGIGYATSSESDEDTGAAIGSTAGATIGAMLCADYSEEPVAEPAPMPEPAPEPEPVPEFEPLVLSSEVNFAFDSAELMPAAHATLNDVARRLIENERSQDVRVHIGGHTDSVGSDQYNLGLSQRRANSVRDYLIARGVESDRLVARGFGEARPVASNETDAGRAQNRRVELNVLN